MSLEPRLLDIVRCPAARSPLALANDETLLALNARILSGNVTDLAGDPVERPLEAALVREDGALAYPIEGGIPVLLASRGIALAS